MSDPIDQPANDQATADSAQETPVAQPSATVTSTEAVKNSLSSDELDKRFSGLLSAMDKKLTPFKTQIAKLERQLLTPEEVQEQDQQSASQELESLRLENQLLRLRGDHPDAVDLITGAMGTTSLEDQIAFIESKLGKATIAKVEAAVEAAAETQATGETDPNNPGRAPKMGAQSAKFGAIDSDEAADAVLAGYGKGALAGLRRNKG